MPFITGRYGQSGPILDMRLGVSQVLARYRTARGLHVPPPINVSMIIDTGCETTLLNEQLMRSLGLESVSSRGILSATSSHVATDCDVYAVELQTFSYGDAPFVVPTLEVVAHPFLNHSIDGLLGRDVLNRIKLLVDGPARQFRFEY